jgi:putative ABC transport system substrate-binding protein
MTTCARFATAAITKFSLVVVVSILAPVVVAQAQPAGKTPRIGVLSAGPANPHIIEAFGKGLRDLGYVEGQNVVIEYRSAEGQPAQLAALAAELVRLQMDVIVAPATPAAVAAKNSTSTIPIVIATVLDPVGLGLIASLRRPGGNITGLTSFLGPEIAGKHLELFKEAIPKLGRVGVLRNPSNPTNTLLLEGAHGAVTSLGMQLRVVDARAPSELESAFREAGRMRIDGLLVLPDNMLWSHRARVAELAVKSRLPTMFRDREHVEAGGLIAYGASLTDLSRRAASFVDKILRGAKPADLPVEQPTTFELVINMKTARALGLKIPPSLLARADQVIE